MHVDNLRERTRHYVSQKPTLHGKNLAWVTLTSKTYVTRTKIRRGRVKKLGLQLFA